MLQETGYESFVDMYNKSKLWGLPFSHLGWAEHPAYIINALTIIGNEHARMEAEQ